MPAGGRGHRFLRRFVAVRPAEVATLWLATGYFFFVLAGWYVLRPIRDAMGVAGGVRNLAWLFLGTLLVSLAAQPLFATLVARWPRRRFVPWTYRFFALNLVIFFVLLRAGLPPEAHVWLGRVFFVWASVFNLFVVSVFWAFMADVFRTGEGKRLFGFIAAGGTLGGMLGGALTGSLVRVLGPAPLLLFGALLLELAVACVRGLGHSWAEPEGERRGRESGVVGGGSWSGVVRTFSSPYLLGIGLFLLLYTVGSTFLYFLQARIVAAALTDTAARVAFFARVDVWVNGLTLLLQTAVAGRLLARIGVGATLVLVPSLTILGFGALGIAPTLLVIAVVQVARRSGSYALSRPARELLFVPLEREDKYKAKTLVDTFVYRLGDQLGAWTETGLGALGLGVSAIAWCAVPVAGAWLSVALWLGRRHARLVSARAADRDHESRRTGGKSWTPRAETSSS
jgi:AAA family ATP:ADP antiporter